MRGTTCCEQDASLAIIQRALRFERIVANADVATTTYAYDANGNLIQAGGRNYVWDYLNRMLASGYNNSTTTYAYDPAGNRVLQTSTTSSTYYPNKYYSLTSTKSGANTYATSTNYVFNGGTLLATIDQALYNGAATGSPITRYIHPDHLGSTNVVTDASGTVAQLLDYYPYGSTRVSSNTYPTNEKRQYIGQFVDTQTSLNYLNARYYDSARGQFISQDPEFWGTQRLTDPQSLNAYSYAEDNPITREDPSGRAASISGILNSIAAILRTISSILSSTNAVTYNRGAAGGGGTSSVPSGSGGGATSPGYGGGGNASPLPAPNVTPNGIYSMYNQRLEPVEQTLIKKKYVWGAAGPDAVDCSGAIIYGIRQIADPHFPRITADSIYNNYTTPTNSTGPGTLNFYDWNGDGAIDHVTSNIGNGDVVNPKNEAAGVITSSSTKLDTYTVDKGGYVYQGQLNWAKIISEQP